MNPDITIRHAQKDDITTISRVLASSWKSAYRGIVHDAYLDALLYDRWVPFLESGFIDHKLQGLVLEKEGMIMGVSLTRMSMEVIYPADGELVSLYLLPGYIGCGYGHALYEAAESELQQEGYTHCVLNVLSDNLRAIRFYHEHGFAETGQETKAALGERDYFCKIMRKAIGPVKDSE